MKAPITSVKHYVQALSTPISSAAKGGFDLVNAVATGTARTSPEEVNEGCVVKACYIEFWVRTATAGNSVSAAIIKIPGGGASAPTYAEMIAMDSYENKKNCLEFHQGLAPAGDQVAFLFRGWYKIPKGKQRFGLGDRLQVVIALTGSAGSVCGFSTYKEYT